MTSFHSRAAIVAGLLAALLPATLAAQDFQPITRKEEFLARLAERKLTYVKDPKSHYVIHFDGSQTLNVNGQVSPQNWTWDGTGYCFSSPGVQPGCADISISGTTARFSWRGEWAEDFVIGN